MPSKFKRCNVILTQAQHDTLKAMAGKGKSISSLCRQAVEQYLYAEALHTDKKPDYTPLETEGESYDAQ